MHWSTTVRCAYCVDVYMYTELLGIVGIHIQTRTHIHVHPGKFMNLTYYNLSIVGDVRPETINSPYAMHKMQARENIVWLHLDL